ncbi:hypothetical protein HA402_001175 [Bradysia odoriphaga]|nr:hypothetical protein HA402_001175 [Bradysia odoriphaga]
MAAVSQHAMRRHPGGPLDPSPSFGSTPYFAIAHQQPLPVDKSKKSWSQRLKITKSDKQLIYNDVEPLAQSALSRSMKYAEPWLYGTIRGIPAPLANRQQMFPQHMAELAVVVCSCPEYLNGTKVDFKKATICKKCRGSRLPLAPMGGTMRLHSTTPILHAARGSAGTVRLPSSYSMKQRPSILNSENDPYDMMRRNRLVSPELQSSAKKANKNRAKSTSPSRKWNDNESDTGRRSILQCEVNAYELISNISHNNEFSPAHDEYDVQIRDKASDLNVTELAGQRIRISGSMNNSTHEDVDAFIYEPVSVIKEPMNYEDNFFQNLSSPKPSDDHALPTRPPRNKTQDPSSSISNSTENESTDTSPKSEYMLTSATLSHLSTDVITNYPTHTIKSILKRPLSSPNQTPAIEYNKPKPSTLMLAHKNRPKSTSSLVDNTIANGKINIVPSAAKTVQFLVENEIIHDDTIAAGELSGTNASEYSDVDISSTQIATNNSNDYADCIDNNNDQMNGFNRNERNAIVEKMENCLPVGCSSSVKSISSENSTLNINGSVDLRCISNVEEDNNLPSTLKSILRRSLSDRRLSDTTLAATVNVIFNDTTALRSKPSKTDSRNIFQELFTSNVTRPRDPPPPPPPSMQKCIEKTPERPPRLAGRRSANYAAEEKSKKVDRIYEEFCFTSPTVTVNNHNHVDEMVELKVSNARNVTPVSDENNEQRKRIQANIEAFQGSRIFGSVNKKTVVKVAPLIINRESVHRLEIKNDEDSQNESKKTSILINGDDCYSTINVNDDTPLYQSSVVVHDSCTSPSITKSSSNTVSINVTTPQTPEEQLTYHNNQINSLLSKNCAKSIIPINDSLNGNVTQRILTNPNQTRTLITLDYSDSNISCDNGTDTKSENELVLLLRNPVEAVKRNLVPHVCGKNVDNDIQSTEDHPEKQSKSGRLAEKLFQTDSTSFISKLLEDPTLGHLAEGLDYELVAKLIENSLVRLKESRNSLDMSGTKDEKDMNKLIETSLQKVKEERQKMEIHKSDMEKTDDDNKSNRDSMSSGNSFSSANYEPYDFDGNDLSDCYQSCSSELTADEDGNMTRTKFYQMLVDATLSEIEISTNIEDDHHYESIRLNGDPIYEEISDIPPPLPLCPPPNDDTELDKKNAKSMFEGASKYDILSYLVDAKERGIVPEDSYTYNFGNSADVIIEEENDKVSGRLHNRQSSDISCRISHISSNSDVSDEASLKQSAQRKSSADIERNDSGVGSETSKTSRSKYQSLPGSILNKNSPIHLCEDCDGPVETQVTDSGVMYAPLVCRKCGKKRAERKEIVTEIVETEEKYGRDLQIILEEFYQPMLVAGLLTQDQLSTIFNNTEELLENSQSLAEKMRDALDIAMEQGDDDLITVNIGKLLLDAAPMLHAFESYCIRQAAASLLLANMEKEKELLRIFLRVSQMENTVLRRMNLNSFLMVPVQRVTKYPLLLARLYKVTPAHLEGRELLKQAQEKIELHLNHMNREAKDVPTKLWRRISSSSPNRRSSCEIDMINIKLRKMAIDLLEWHHDEVRFAIEGKLLFTQPNDNNWRKGRTIKLTPVNALLVTNGKPSATYKVDKVLNEQLNFPRHTGIREASLLLVREKSGRYTLLREPLFLDRCIVCTEADWEDYFEVQEISSKDTFIFKAEDGARTKQWYAQLQYHSQGMGAWRKRRNALANIMINGMMMRT